MLVSLVFDTVFMIITNN